MAIKREKVAESREKQSLAALHAREPSPTARASGSGIARQREVNALIEFRVPFELDRQQIDDVERVLHGFWPSRRIGQSSKATPRPGSAAFAKGLAIR